MFIGLKIAWFGSWYIGASWECTDWTNLTEGWVYEDDIVTQGFNGIRFIDNNINFCLFIYYIWISTLLFFYIWTSTHLSYYIWISTLLYTIISDFLSSYLYLKSNLLKNGLLKQFQGRRHLFQKDSLPTVLYNFLLNSYLFLQFIF